MCCPPVKSTGVGVTAAIVVSATLAVVYASLILTVVAVVLVLAVVVGLAALALTRPLRRFMVTQSTGWQQRSLAQMQELAHDRVLTGTVLPRGLAINNGTPGHVLQGGQGNLVAASGSHSEDRDPVLVRDRVR